MLPRFYDASTNDINWTDLERAVRAGLRFQDNVTTYSMYFVDEQRKQQLSERRVGLGTMGLGTLLIQLGLRYGSDESLKFIDKLYGFMAEVAYDENANLAREKGSFPQFDAEKYLQSGFMQTMPEHIRDKIREYGARCVTVLTSAPCGSSSTYIDALLQSVGEPGTSSGIEPYYAFEYFRASRAGKIKQSVAFVQKWRDAHPGEELPEYMVVASDLSPEDHIRVQAAVQRWTDSSISKTANLPAEYTVDDVKRFYDLAYTLGTKGTTIYRSGSREAQVLSTTEEGAVLENELEQRKVEQLKHELVEHSTANVIDVPLTSQLSTSHPKRPSLLHGFTQKVKVPLGSDGRLGKVYITVNLDNDTGLPIEVFINANDPELRSTASALGRMTTQFLRYGCTRNNVEQAMKHLRRGEHIGSLPFTLASILDRVVYGKIETPVAPQRKVEFGLQECPSCHNNAYDHATCVCLSCGYSSCN